MATSPTKPFRMAPLQRLTVRPIEDPAEQAALDERLKRSEKAVSDVSTPASGSPGATDDECSSPIPVAGIRDGSEALPSTPSRPSTRKRRR